MHRSRSKLLNRVSTSCGALLTCVLTLALASTAFAVDASTVIETGVLPKRWLDGGPDCGKLPPFQIHAYNANFYILRESGCLNAEKPFLYLIFGEKQAVLFDTGAGDEEGIEVTPDVAGAVKLAIKLWSVRTKKSPLPLLVSHLHSHGDHTFGDSQLAALPFVTLVPPSDVGALQAAFGIASWPEDVGQLDLGGRVLDIVPIPGHDETSIAVYDRKTGVLLTGDTMYPGRVYINGDPDVFARSIERLVAFTEDKIVAHVLGTHIEQSGPYSDYPVGTHYAPIEAELGQSRGALLELLEATTYRDETGAIIQRAFRDFSVCGPYPSCDPVNL